MPKRRLLLLGGGHAHVQVVRAFAAAPPPATEVTLLSATRLTAYSGMLPGLIAGHYAHADAHIDLASLCESAGVRFVEQRARALDPIRCQVETIAGEAHAYDILSIDTGSAPPAQGIPGAADHGIPVKPVEGFLRAIESMDAAVEAGRVRSIAIIGAGAAGFEVALAIDHRLRRGLNGRPRPSIDLYTDADSILPELPARVRTYGMHALRRQAIDVHTHARVAEVMADGLRLSDGSVRAANVVYIVTGAAPAPIYRAAGLDTDSKGFVVVHPTLQSVSHPKIFACGDVATVAAHPRPKAGVFAVRQGPPLTENLRRALAGAPPLPFVPQQAYLVLLSTGAKHAIATRNGLALQGRWIWRWKDHIDRRFMVGFRPDAVARMRR